MIDFATNLSFALLGLGITFALVRALRGPSLADRILALDTATVLAIGLIGVFAVRTGLYLYADIGIALALVGFLSTAAFARYLLSRHHP